MLMPLQNSRRTMARPRGLGSAGMGQSNLVTPTQYNNMFGWARSAYAEAPSSTTQSSPSPSAWQSASAPSRRRRNRPFTANSQSTGEAAAYIPGLAPQAPPDNSLQSQAVYAEQLAAEEQMNPGLVPSSIAASAAAASSAVNLAPGATAYPVEYLPATDTTSTSTSWFTDPTQEIITGVENWMLVAGAGVLLFMFMGRRSR